MHTTVEPTAPSGHPLAWLMSALDGAGATAPTAVRTRHLRHGETLVVEQPLGVALICTEGSLWITHDREPEDHIVDRGGRYVAAHRERMLVHAISDATVQLLPVGR